MDIGGQAVVEGVMMRGKKGYSTVVRKQDGTLTREVVRYRSYSERYRILGLPVFRGFVALVESLVIGLKTLSYSADVAIEDEDDEGSAGSGDDTTKEKGGSWFAGLVTIAIALVAGVGLFMALPYYITGHLPLTRMSSPVLFNLTAGLIRILFFLLYVYAISFIGDVRRLFEYHGAEHKAIACHENNQPLDAEHAKAYSTCHERCGTSFLLIAGLSCIIVFAFADAVIAVFWNAYVSPPWYLRVPVHLALVPIVSGLSYEVLKYSAKNRNGPLTRILTLPGIWLQRITTREPDTSQLEVAFESLREVLKLENS